MVELPDGRARFVCAFGIARGAALLDAATVVATPPAAVLSLGVAVEYIARLEQAGVGNHEIVQRRQVTGRKCRVTVSEVAVGHGGAAHRGEAKPDVLAIGVDAIRPRV